jgi:DNA-binding cell septation regulator SpoVG
MVFGTKNKTGGNKRNDLPKFILKGRNATISGAKCISDRCVVFTLNVDGASFYGLRVVAGSKGDFISMPQYQGRDGKYYDMYRLFLEESDVEKIIEAVAGHYVDKDEVADYKTRVKVEV